MDLLIDWSTKFSIRPYLPFFLALTLFVLPISSTAKSVCLSLTLIAILFSPRCRMDIRDLLQEKWCRAAIALFILAFLACFWSSARFSEKMLILEKYIKFLYLPILVVGFRSAKARLWALHGFLLAMLLTTSIAILGAQGVFDLNPDYIFRNHIMVGYMLDFAAYLSILFSVKQRGLKRVAYLLLFLLFSYHVLFINGGRMGYITYFVLMSLLIAQFFSWRTAIAGFLIFCSAFLIIYQKSPSMKERLHLVSVEITKYKHQEKDTPVGYRLQFYKFAKKIFKRHPLFGSGTGSFTYHFRTKRPVPSWQNRLLEPHNQYLLVAVEFGLVGVGLLMYLFFSFITESLRLTEMRPIAFAMLACFLLGNLTDSLLLYSGSGYFFILFIALSFGELPAPKSYR